MPRLVEPRSITTTDLVERQLRGPRTDVGGTVFQVLLLAALVALVAILVALLGDVFRRALPVLESRPADFLTSDTSANAADAGVAQGLVGSVLLMVFVAVLALPVGMSAAVYLEEYAHDSAATRLLNSVVRNLAGVPAIVYGLLGLAIFAQALRPLTGGRSLVAGGLTLAVLVLPIVIITTSEALRAVPRSIREAAYAVGATRWEVVRFHVLPYAAPGILTGTILSLSRAFGETAPLLLVGAIVGGFSVVATSPLDLLQGPYTALPTIVYAWTRQPQEEFRALAAAAIVVLIVVMLAINLGAILLRNRHDRRW